MRNLILFGGPGSGKGTQSAKLINRYGLHHISTGEVLRDHIKRDTHHGKVAKKYIAEGQLIPDALMLEILGDLLDSLPADVPGVIFDGFPRTIAQAQALDEMLGQRGMEVEAVIGLEVPDDELIDRLVKRGAESGRSDDNPEVIAKRLEVYHDTTSPLCDYYTTIGKYRSINGLGTVDDIFNRIVNVL